MTKMVGFSKQTIRMPLAIVRLFVFLSVFCSALLGVTLGQSPPTEKPASDPVSGKYEGVAKAAAAETRLALEITDAQGKVSGRLVSPQGDLIIKEGTFNGGKLALKLGKGDTESTLIAQLQDDKLIGDWTEGGQTRSIELKKVGDKATVVVTVIPPEVSLNGEWDGVADAQGQDFPFQLILKVEGEKITGSSSSSLGSATISNGSYKDGKLVFQIDSPGGSIFMNGVLKDGGLIGEFDYAGQSQGKWVAKKRNP